MQKQHQKQKKQLAIKKELFNQMEYSLNNMKKTQYQTSLEKQEMDKNYQLFMENSLHQKETSRKKKQEFGDLYRKSMALKQIKEQKRFNKRKAYEMYQSHKQQEVIRAQHNLNYIRKQRLQAEIQADYMVQEQRKKEDMKSWREQQNDLGKQHIEQMNLDLDKNKHRYTQRIQTIVNS